MPAIDKPALLDTSLIRAAELLGDITPHVMARYYTEMPEARAHFAEWDPQGRSALEGQMIETSLYCLMHWFDAPEEIRIILVGTVPHHIETLHIPPHCFSGLIDSICDVIAATIPADHADEQALWQELRAAMAGLFAEGVARLSPARRISAA